MPTDLPVSRDDVVRARDVIDGLVHRTPLWRSETLGRLAGVDLYLKLECFQKTGSFKPRGALSRVRRLAPDERARGLVTVSAGNHAQALAYAAGAAGVPCTVVMPASASPAKAAAAAGYGADVRLEGATSAEAFGLAQRLAAERDLVFVHPYDDPRVIAGQGTVGLEIAEQLPGVRTVVVPVGGGGLISGIAVALAGSGVRIVGVEPEGAPTLTEALRAGEPVRLDAASTVADALTAPFAGTLTLPIVSSLVARVALVSDDQIVHALRLLLERAKVLAEPGGAAGLAAVLGRVAGPVDSPAVVVVSGGNVDLPRLAAMLA